MQNTADTDTDGRMEYAVHLADDIAHNAYDDALIDQTILVPEAERPTVRFMIERWRIVNAIAGEEYMSVEEAGVALGHAYDLLVRSRGRAFAAEFARTADIVVGYAR